MTDRFAATVENGRLAWQGSELTVGFRINLAEDGTVAISLDPIPSHHHNGWVVALTNSDRRQPQALLIEGRDSEGRLIRSESAYIQNFISKSDQQGHRWELALEAMEVEVTPSHTELPAEDTTKCRAEYYTIGQEGVFQVTRQTSVGIVAVCGESRATDYRDITGEVIVEGPSETRNIERWYHEAEALTTRLLEMLSLAQGRRIYWSVRQRYLGDRLDCLTLAGPNPTSPPMEPLFSNINLGPAIDMAVDRYTDSLRRSTGMDVALDWYLAHPRFLEAEILTCMTALEHLVNTYIGQEHSRSVLPIQAFQSLRDDLEKAIDSAIEGFANDGSLSAALKGEVGQAMKRGLGNLNSYPLRQNLFAMLEAYQVPVDDIRDRMNFIEVRNSIAHRGYASDKSLRGEPLSSHLSILRELLKRVFLTLLKYEGEYQCTLGGWRWAKFPPEIPSA